MALLLIDDLSQNQNPIEPLKVSYRLGVWGEGEVWFLWGEGVRGDGESGRVGKMARW